MSDLIDRQAAIDAIYHHLPSKTMLECRTMLHEVPTVDVPDRKVGEWIDKEVGGWHCSECGVQAPFWCFSTTQNLANFCPNCGARMKGEDDE